MAFIEEVTIKGLWGIKDIHVNLYDDINIFIGDNGSSKTTFLRIIESLLNVDIYNIQDVEFEEVNISVKSEAPHSITVIRMKEDVVSDNYRYIIDGETIDMSMYDSRNDLRSRRLSRPIYYYIRDKIVGIVNVSWLSINRLDENTYRDYADSSKSFVDQKLDLLLQQIVSYRLRLETEVNKRTKKFNEDLVSLLLYNEKFDTLSYGDDDYRLFQNDEVLITKLHQIFSYFGDAQNHTLVITQHVEKIKDIVNKIKSNSALRVSDLPSLSLLKRTNAILKVANDYQKDRDNILEPIKKYTEIVGLYFKDKKIQFNAITGEITPALELSKGKIVNLSINSLSSGEKQLLILLTETLLQQNQSYVFIADEPELSLHIEWQRNLISSIRNLNPNVQILFATHAPEIVANYPKRIINMSSISTLR
ncbi:MAG: AAA family ATPase [Bacteroidaceae bacterium]|nr:AAA family ATPase [Bacteroidaceae bacterium]